MGGVHQLTLTRLSASSTSASQLREGLTSILIRAGFADGELDPIVFALAATAAIAVPGNPLDRCEPTLVADELGRTWPRFLSACAAGAPTLIVIEDLHWAGPQMLEMVEQLAFHLAHDPGNSLPDALYAVLAARIDALPVPERRVLQEAAVFGRAFWAAALSNAVPRIDVLAELRRLERRALVSLRPRSTLGDRAECAFKHMLVRDVAYASLPSARRVRAHAEASSWIEAAAGDRLGELIELIAFHDVEAAVGEAGAWHDSAGYEQIRSRAYTHALQAGSTPGAGPQWAMPCALTGKRCSCPRATGNASAR